MKTNAKYAAAAAAIGLLSICTVVILIAGSIMTMKTRALDDDYAAIMQDGRYGEAVAAAGIEPLTQEVSCGYAVIEMLSAWEGRRVTERALLEENGSVTTSTGATFCEEADRRLSRHSVSMHSYQSNSELLRTLHESLEHGNPVAVEWAAREGGEAGPWTLHYSVVTAMDLEHDAVTVANPYGYTEKITADEFLARTSFEAFDHKPFWMELAFSFGIFEKNTVFVLEPYANLTNMEI